MKKVVSQGIALCCVVGLLAGCSPGGSGTDRPPSGAGQSQGAKGSPDPSKMGRPTPQVTVIAATPRRVALTSVLPGRTAAFRVAEIRPQVNGLVLKREFVEGSLVKAGQLLYTIDPAPFEAALDNARAAMARAQANLPAAHSRAERFKALLDDKGVSQQEYDEAAAAERALEAEIVALRAQIRSAQINLDHTRVAAPISGRIGKSNITDGAIVTAYQPQPLATIQQIDPIYVDVTQSTGEVLRLNRRLQSGRLTPGSPERQHKVGLFLEDGTPYSREGTLNFRDIAVDPGTGAVTLRMTFPNPEGRLLPGMFVRAEVSEGMLDAAIVVPQPSVLRTPKGEPFVYTVDAEGKVQTRMLTLDRELGDQWLVASGLSTGEQVVVEGVQILQMMPPGVPIVVKATPYQPGAKRAPGPAPAPVPGK